VDAVGRGWNTVDDHVLSNKSLVHIQRVDDPDLLI
jgi:hypothetical protein